MAPSSSPRPGSTAIQSGRAASAVRRRSPNLELRLAQAVTPAVSRRARSCLDCEERLQGRLHLRRRARTRAPGDPHRSRLYTVTERSASSPLAVRRFGFCGACVCFGWVASCPVQAPHHPIRCWVRSAWWSRIDLRSELFGSASPGGRAPGMERLGWHCRAAPGHLAGDPPGRGDRSGDRHLGGRLDRNPAYDGSR